VVITFRKRTLGAPADLRQKAIGLMQMSGNSDECLSYGIPSSIWAPWDRTRNGISHPVPVLGCQRAAQVTGKAFIIPPDIALVRLASSEQQWNHRERSFRLYTDPTAL